MNKFEKWWEYIGSGIVKEDNEDSYEHVKRVCGLLNEHLYNQSKQVECNHEEAYHYPNTPVDNIYCPTCNRVLKTKKTHNDT